MNYELAKELKDAGYKMPEHDYDFELPVCHRCDYFGAEFCQPTLSELIEACGADFFALMNTIDGWMAHANKYHGTSRNFVDNAMGKTLEEAVAKLWIALNKKP